MPRPDQPGGAFPHPAHRQQQGRHQRQNQRRSTAGRKLCKARTATIRTTLINIPARLAFSAGTYTLHLPANSRRERPFLTMFDNVQAPPKAA